MPDVNKFKSRAFPIVTRRCEDGTPRRGRKGLNRDGIDDSGQLDSLVPGRRKWRRSRKFVLEIPMGSRGRGRERSATIRVDPALRPIHPLLAPLTTLEPYLADNSSFACSKLSATWRRRGEVFERGANAKNVFENPSERPSYIIKHRKGLLTRDIHISRRDLTFNTRSNERRIRHDTRSFLAHVCYRYRSILE